MTGSKLGTQIVHDFLYLILNITLIKSNCIQSWKKQGIIEIECMSEFNLLSFRRKTKWYVLTFNKHASILHQSASDSKLSSERASNSTSLWIVRPPQMTMLHPYKLFGCFLEGKYCLLVCLGYFKSSFYCS